LSKSTSKNDKHEVGRARPRPTIYTEDEYASRRGYWDPDREVAEIRRGRPCIASTGVIVRRVAGWHNLGLAPEEIAAKMEHLTLAQIHAALVYYQPNRDEIDTDIAAEDAAVEDIFPARA
jgi:uncharacterized protein (DUF433 family)